MTKIRNWVPLAAIGGLGGLLLLVATSKKRKEGEGAALDITIVDKVGNAVPHHSPDALGEGESYVARVTVGNKTMKGGVPWEAELTLIVVADVHGIATRGGQDIKILIPETPVTDWYDADQVITYDYPFTVPMGTANYNGTIKADVIAPTGAVLAYVSKGLSVTGIAIDYGATVILI